MNFQSQRLVLQTPDMHTFFVKPDVGLKKHLGNQVFNVHDVLLMQRLRAPSRLNWNVFDKF